MARLNMSKVNPDAYRALLHFDHYLASTGLSDTEKDLIKIRASQINGCGFCVNMHTVEARNHGETEQRINLVCVWRESGDIFTDEEKLLFAMTEEITLIHKKGLSDELYDKAVQTFGELKTSQILMAVIIINSWNRLAVSLNTHPEKA